MHAMRRSHHNIRAAISPGDRDTYNTVEVATLVEEKAESHSFKGERVLHLCTYPRPGGCTLSQCFMHNSSAVELYIFFHENYSFEFYPSRASFGVRATQYSW